MSSNPNRIVPPEFVTLESSEKRYLSINNADTGNRGTPIGLRASKTMDDIDKDSEFEVFPNGYGEFYLKGNNGRYVELLGVGFSSGPYFKCSRHEGITGSPLGFELIPAGGNNDQFYLRSYSVYERERHYLSDTHPSAQDGVTGYPNRNSRCLFTISEPVDSKVIFDVEYDLRRPKLGREEVSIQQHEIVNNTRFDSKLDGTTSYTYKKSTVGTWNNTAGFEIGTKISFKVSTVPFVVENGIDLTMKASYSHSWGGSKTEEETYTITASGHVPPMKRAVLKFIVKRKKMDVNFTYKERVRYKNRPEVVRTKKGIYSNVETFDAQSILTDVRDL
ncbi:hypothetical protein LshimejAT787_0902160 [Lyophyllum shimeji]|uniref:Uncharacterized protein n=1 Tax=Lyophyllum shimeji TaxID=47721 RepID=A0A9P3PSN2_LYOSH|nr:hypothetical protein LshimejAT787_0902160 [Lyophyllum shimeji]